VKAPDIVEVCPSEFFTTTSATPDPPLPVVQVIWVPSEEVLGLTHLIPPILTVALTSKLLPVIVTRAPAPGYEVGEIEEVVGAGAAGVAEGGDSVTGDGLGPGLGEAMLPPPDGPPDEVALGLQFW
jgi:hypothetical protein